MRMHQQLDMLHTIVAAARICEGAAATRRRVWTCVDGGHLSLIFRNP